MRLPMALAAESAIPSTMMPEKAVDSAGTHAPIGVLETADSQTGVAIPADMHVLTHTARNALTCFRQRRYTCPHGCA